MLSGKNFWVVVLLELAVLAGLGAVLLQRHVRADGSAATSAAHIVDRQGVDPVVMRPVEPRPRAARARLTRSRVPARRRPAMIQRDLPPLSQPTLVVEKSRRRLVVYDRGRPVKVYDADGGGRIGDKIREGDRRTPEGEFYVCAKNPRSQYTRALHLSYPNVEDAERGLRDGLIGRTDYYRIVAAIGAGQVPPQDTRLGSWIMIHGDRGGGRDTLGCVALEDRDILELYPRIPVGTPVIVRP
ncbi:MAG: L,D-transpeptidase family protein [Phycisphaerae bacterium]|nr:L,D-transpeptidase family protein [Phycisphaerae bacterium]